MIALALYTAAFVAEIVRAGITSVSQGQKLAAQALGLSPWQQLRLVVLPQALRVIVPALTNQLLSLTKNSSLAVAVGYPELVSIANTSLNSTGRAFECIAVIMAVYLALSLLISGAMNRYNARVALQGLAMSGAARAAIAWRAELWGSPLRAASTVCAASLLFGWAGFHMRRLGACCMPCSAPTPRPAAPSQHGACWGVIAEKWRPILFGRYPYEDQWRPAIAVTRAVG